MHMMRMQSAFKLSSGINIKADTTLTHTHTLNMTDIHEYTHTHTTSTFNRSHTSQGVPSKRALKKTLIIKM